MATTTKRIVFQRPDGSLVIRFFPVGEEFLPGETEAMYLDGKALHNPPAGCVRVDTAGVALADLQALGRSFAIPGTDPTTEALVSVRECLVWDGSKVAVSLPKLRGEYLRALRQERGRRLKDTDGEYVRLLDVGTQQQLTTVKQHRQALRDLPATVTADLAALDTVNKIKAYQPQWPSV